jgi:outer membrane protein insertion porin family
MKRALILAGCVLLFSIAAQAQFRNSSKKTAQTAVTEETLNYANPADYIIGGIDVIGLNVLDKNAMISLTGLRVGDKVKIPGEGIATALRKLWKHGLVGDASIQVERIEDKNVFLVIHLAERPRLTDFYFTGISKGKQTELKKDLKLIRGKIVNDANIRNAELSVRRHFVKKGFLNTTVKITREADSLNRGGIRLKIDVALKAKVRIAEIKFDGNKNVDAYALKMKMKKTHERAGLFLHRTILGSLLHLKSHQIKEFFDSSQVASWRDVKGFITRNVKLNFFNGSKFIKADYDEDKTKLIEYYNTQGYRDAEIVKDTVAVHDASSIDIKININEGTKYYFRNIIWTGNFLYSDASLNKILDIRKGDVYNKELIERKTSFDPKGGGDIGGLYMDDGYLFFRVVPVEVAVEGDSIDLEMRIFEGDQAIVNEVIISGNERTSEHVIRRELSTIPGQKFRRSDIIRTQQLLSQMGYFNPQKISQDIRPNPATGTVDIEWKLAEQSNDQVELSGGWGGYYGFVGTVGLSFNNFSARNFPHFHKWKPLPTGDGQKVSIRAQANGKSYQSYSLSFTEPWLGGKKPNSLTVSLNRSISKQPIFGANRNYDYTNGPALRQTGITVGLGRRLSWPDNYFTLTNSLSMLVYDYKNNYFRSTALPANGETYSVKLNTTISRNSIDNPMYPTSGSTLSLSLDLTPPYSLWRNPSYINDVNQRYKWIELNKWMFDAKYYIKLLGSPKPEGRSLVIEAKMHFGVLSTYRRGFTPGPFERFIMGGAGLAGGFNSFVLGQDIIGLRGYQDNLVTPPIYAGQQGATTTNTISGGTVYDKFGIELRYPITTGQSATIYALAFTEGGNNWNNFQNFNPFTLYKSAGIGARIFMPAFGLIGLNWAYGFDTLPGALQRSGPQFHFTIGQQIR